MEFIKNKNKRVASVLGKQIYYKNKKYSFIAYTKAVHIAEGVLLENTLTRQLVLLTEEEYANPKEDTRAHLVENWYLVPNDLDAKSLNYSIFNSCVSRTKKQAEGVINNFTIFTTMECNARCAYCYEAGRAKTTMTEQTAADVLKFMSRMRGSEPVHIGWFGGEPLVNATIMDVICHGLSKMKIPYTTSIISNGYLFDRHTEDTIRNVWKLQRAQITLDGTEENYIAIKNYIDSSENPFERVLNNIQYLTECGVRVTIRMNESADNSRDLIALSKELETRFANNNLLSAYAHPLFEDSSKELTSDDWAATYQGFIDLDKSLKKVGLRFIQSIDTFKTSHCMADVGNSVCITPDGQLTLCEHHTEDEIIGNIWDGVTNTDVVEQWREFAQEKAECASCWYYPKCMRLAKCAVKNDCDHGMLNFWSYQEDESIINTYHQYLQRKEKDKMKETAIFDSDIVINLAIEQIGKTLDDRDFWKEIFPKMRQRGWCLTFIFAILIEAYGADNMEAILYTRDKTPDSHIFAKYFRDINRLYSTPKVGDIAFYKSYTHNWVNHCGLVVAVSEDETTFDDVEGNVERNGVSVVCRVNHIPVENNQYLVGFGRPNYRA